MNQIKFQTDFRPEQIHPSVFIAQGVVIVGDVTVGEDCGVWFNATLRGDTDPITIGPRTNIQEGAIFHADPGYPVAVGAGATIGHRAVIHGAEIGDNALIGMGAVVLNGAVIGQDCIVGASALVTSGKTFPAGSLILGNPAKLVRSLRPEEIEGNRLAAETYVKRALAFKGG